ncbi:hypothetical protein [Sphingomonas sp. Leaf198]|uniref:hypothetical protein n=1 Tax=Sphingomonas sp. Leaf198 TaxID=1736299 RepID=UPI0006F236EF|nr:hypothetical protein [Sphingomonas sp. Leaf198]KQS50635.1 hypothetical protein ASG20_00355 [Sphingomonas sp. Leaf198]
MTREALILSDITTVLIGLIAAPFFAWFAIRGVKAGVVETKFGNPDRSIAPVRFWSSVAVYFIGFIFSCSAIVFGIADIIFGFRFDA